MQAYNEMMDNATSPTDEASLDPAAKKQRQEKAPTTPALAPANVPVAAEPPIARFSDEQLECFDEEDFGKLKADKKNSQVIRDLFDANPAVFQYFVNKCMSSDEAEVKIGVSGLVGFLAASFPGSQQQLLDNVDVLANKLAKVNRGNTRPFSALLQSPIFKDSSRFAVFDDEEDSGSWRLLELFKIQDPEANPPDWANTVRGNDADDWPLVFLDAESGNGKTTACKWLATPSDDLKTDPDVIFCVLIMVLEAEKSKGEAPQDTKAESAEERLDWLKNTLTRKMKRQFDKLKTPLQQEGFRNARWIIAVDEVAYAPIRTRALCRNRVLVARHVRKELHLKKPLRIVAAGTGSCRVVAPASFPQHYRVVELLGQKNIAPPAGCAYSAFCSMLSAKLKNVNVATWQLWTRVMEIPYLTQATKNPRFAECVLIHCVELTSRANIGAPIMITPSMVDTVVELSGVYFKNLNGCNIFNPDEMMWEIAKVVRHAVAPRLAMELPANHEVSGMGRDTVKAVLSDKVSPEDLVIDSISVSENDTPGSKTLEYALVIKKGSNRFRVSDHQWSLIALGYGRGEPEPRWENFESAVALHLRLTMIGVQGEHVWGALQTLSCREQPFDEKFNLLLGAPPTFADACARTLSYTRIACWTETEKLEKASLVPSSEEMIKNWRSAAESPDSGAAAKARQLLNLEERKSTLLQRIKAALHANLGVVIVNAPHASFADVIFLSKELVVLVQAKYYGPGSPLGQGKVRLEIEKFGVTSLDPWFIGWLQGLVGTDKPLPLVVSGIMSTKSAADLSVPPPRHKGEWKQMEAAPSSPILVMQWSVDSGFVVGSKVRFRFPEPNPDNDDKPALTIIETGQQSEALADLTHHFLIGTKVGVPRNDA